MYNNFIHLEDDKQANKWILYVGERWKDFKTKLITDYITNSKSTKLTHPYVTYSFINKDV